MLGISVRTFVLGFVLVGLSLSSQAHARRGNRSRARAAALNADVASGSCSDDSLLQGTDYFLPQEDIPSSYAMYPNFSAAVATEGSGIMSDGTIMHYDGSVTKQSCDKWNDEYLVKGSARRCLIPYFSLAADKEKYPAGTIIEVPEMKGQMIQVSPRGDTLVHPGFFIVDDVGSAIKGEGRFDFYTGALTERDHDNPFGFWGKFALGLGLCNKHYRTIFYSEDPDSEYMQALTEIESAASVTIKGQGRFSAP